MRVHVYAFEYFGVVNFSFQILVLWHLNFKCDIYSLFCAVVKLNSTKHTTCIYYGKYRETLIHLDLNQQRRTPSIMQQRWCTEPCTQPGQPGCKIKTNNQKIFCYMFPANTWRRMISFRSHVLAGVKLTYRRWLYKIFHACSQTLIYHFVLCNGYPCN